MGNKYKYQLYYFSRNLEHVVFNEPNPENEFKYDNIEKFVEELKLNIEVFLKKYLPNIESLEYENQYRESWVHIANDKIETIIQHNQGKNPKDFDYEFNLDYGKEYIISNDVVKSIRDIVDNETMTNINNNS